jgi:hypothetical protein
MPSFDITSEVDMVALRNAVEGANRKITGRYDFKGTDARVEQADKLLTLYGDSEFQLEQIQTLLLPEMTAKKIDVRCLKHGDIQKVSGNKVKQELTVRVVSSRSSPRGSSSSSRTASSRYRLRSRARRCASAAPSATSCRTASPWCARRLPIFRCNTATSVIEPRP